MHVLYMYCACTVHVLYMYCACTVHVQYMYSTCTVHAQYMYSTCTVHALCMYSTCTVHVLYMHCTKQGVATSTLVTEPTLYTHTVCMLPFYWTGHSEHTCTCIHVHVCNKCYQECMYNKLLVLLSATEPPLQQAKRN